MSDEEVEDYIPAIHEQGTDTVIRTSELTTAQMCMRKVGYSRYYGRTAPSEPMIAGMSVDDALTYHNTQRINGRPGLDEDQLIDYAISIYREKMQEALEKWGLVRGDFDSEAETMMRLVLPLYMQHFDPICEPVETQGTASWKDEKTGLTLVGHVDLVRKATHEGETHEIISDYKFTKKTSRQMPAATSQQLHAYSLLRGSEPYHVELVLLRKLKTPKIETSSHFVTAEERQAVIHVLRSIGAMMKYQIWPMANPAEWYCNSSWCDHWARCRGNKGGPLPLPGEEGFDEQEAKARSDT